MVSPFSATWRNDLAKLFASGLEAIAGLAKTDGNIIVGNGTTWVAESGATARTSLGLGTGDTPDFTGLVGTTTNDNAASGVIGEYVESNIASGSAVGLTSGVQANVSSISLTAGDWDVRCFTAFNTAAGTSVTVLVSSISQTSATVDNTTGGAAQRLQFNAVIPGAGSPFRLGSTGPIRISLASTTTIYHVTNAVFTASTLSAFGLISARRIR